VAVVGLAASTIACGGGAHGGPGAAAPKQPMGQLTVTRPESPEDAPDGAKTIQVEYAFKRDLLNKDFDKTFEDGFQKKGLDVKGSLTAHSHFDVKDAKITGTVTYLKKGLHYSIVQADLVAEAHYDADVQVDLDVQVKGDTKKAKDDDWDGTVLGGKPVPIVKNIMPTNIPIVGPLFLHAHFDLSAACDVQIEGNLHATTGVGVAGDVRLGAHYKKEGFETPDGKKKKFTFEAKAPNFELAPRPYLKVDGKQQKVKGRCSLQPTAVLLLENMVGAKLSVEPYVELEAKRASLRDKWQLDAQAGIEVTAATNVQIFGRQLRKPKEYTLFDISLTKKGDELGVAPTSRVASRTAPATKGGKASKADVANAAVANMLSDGLGPDNLRGRTATAMTDPAEAAEESAAPASASAPASAPAPASAASASAPAAASASASASAPAAAPAAAAAPASAPASAAAPAAASASAAASAPASPASASASASSAGERAAAPETASEATTATAAPPSSDGPSRTSGATAASDRAASADSASASADEPAPPPSPKPKARGGKGKGGRAASAAPRSPAPAGGAKSPAGGPPRVAGVYKKRKG